MTALKSTSVKLTGSVVGSPPEEHGGTISHTSHIIDNQIPKKLRSRSPKRLLDLSSKDFDLDVIGHSLAYQCRFGGHTPIFYSVADHSRLVASLLPQDLKLWGLFHDAAESFITDIPTPLKEGLWVTDAPNLFSFRGLEDSILYEMSKWVRLPWPIPEQVKEADKEAFRLEVTHFWGGQLSDRVIEHMTSSPTEGKLRWIRRVKKLKGKTGWG